MKYDVKRRNMMQKKKRRGFTLVELAIVIAIIAVLAAILVPTLTNVIKKANIQKGTTTALRISTVLGTEAAFNDRTYYEDYELEDMAESAGYSLKSPASGYSYWYNRAENRVYFKKTDEVLEKGTLSDGATASAGTIVAYADEAEDNSDTLEPRAFFANKNIRYIEKGKNALTQVIDAIESGTVDVIKSRIESISTDGKVVAAAKNHFAKFSVENCAYITNDGWKGKTDGEAYVYVVPGLTGVPSRTSGSTLKAKNEIVIPATVIACNEDSFHGVVSAKTTASGASESVKVVATSIAFLDFCNTNKESLTNIDVVNKVSKGNTSCQPFPTGAYTVIYGYQKMGFEYGTMADGKGISYTADGIINGTNGIIETEVLLDGKGYSNGKGQTITGIGREFLVPTIQLNADAFANKVASATIRSELIGNGMKFTMVVVDKKLNTYKLSDVTIMTDLKTVTIDKTAQTLSVDLPDYGIANTGAKINWAGTEYDVNVGNEFSYEITYITGKFKSSQVGGSEGTAADFVASDEEAKTVKNGEQYTVTDENPVIKVVGVRIYMNLKDGENIIKKEIYRSDKLNVFPTNKTV